MADAVNVRANANKATSSNDPCLPQDNIRISEYQNISQYHNTIDSTHSLLCLFVFH